MKIKWQRLRFGCKQRFVVSKTIGKKYCKIDIFCGRFKRSHIRKEAVLLRQGAKPTYEMEKKMRSTLFLDVTKMQNKKM